MASGDERHTKRHTKADAWATVGKRQPKQHLGPFRRELLMHLAIREARVRLFGTDQDRRDLRSRGLAWVPAHAVHPHIDLSKSLANRISGALRALEELGFVETLGHADGRRRTARVRITRQGRREALDTSFRWGHSATTWVRQPPAQVMVRILKRELSEAIDESERRRLKREIREARQIAASPVARFDRDRRIMDALRARARREPMNEDAAEELAFAEESPFFNHVDHDPDEHLDQYGRSAKWLRELADEPAHRHHAEQSWRMLFAWFRD